MSLRDELPGAGKRRNDPPPQATHRRATVCEYSRGPCLGHGKPEVAIQDGAGNVIGYVCQKCYMHHVANRGLDQFSQWKPTGTQLQTVQHTFEDDRKAKHFAEVVSELDALADRYVAEEQERGDDDGRIAG
jgi:hypothetical protein